MENSRYLTLNTGAKMPALGLGTWRSEPDLAANAVEHALLRAGYRHIDCAAIYRNEQEIGAVFKKVFEAGTIIKREDVFITSKLWNTEHGRGNVRKACEQTLRDLNLKYLDLYLVHWGVAIPTSSEQGPAGRLTERLDEKGFLVTEKISLRETWEAMEELVRDGLVKAIGVANFTAPMLIDLMSYAKIIPAVNQVEMHPYLAQQKLVDFCKYRGITLTAYSPLGSPGNYKDKGSLMDDPVILELATRHGKTPAQIILRWGIQRDTVVIPKSITAGRITENINIWDFQLGAEEMSAVSGLDRGLRFLDPYEWWKIPYFG